MKLNPKTVMDVENTFDYLLGVVSLAEDGDREDLEDGAFNYARMVLEAAEEPMDKLGMYDITLQTFNAAEELALTDKFTEALHLLVGAVRVLREKSGTNEKLRRLN